ncbi:MAG: molybdopterin biosynthesis protein [Chloroflexi bacterium]|nr:MAG: molybdopterin biosynthesis protein [Chloroflexota bacterium]MBL1194198.1 molybdopterin biosynthesis protein [Chloroflexota bacterium]NOH11491.1 molybdopterin biosynthesis protein [Chloroflexota bacterium]
MSVYLHDIPLPEAQQRFREALQSAGLDGVLGQETISLGKSALGRTLAGPIWAKLSSPHYHAAAMDGFAVTASDTNGASQSAPLSLEYVAQAVYVDTGDVLPLDKNAVIPIEVTEALDAQEQLHSDPRQPHAIRIREAVTPWQHVRPMGEDMVATELVLPEGHTLRPVDLGAIAAAGHSHVTVARKPKVAVLPTGSELVSIGETVKPGDIIEFNSLILATQVEEWGGEARQFPITPDDEAEIKAQVLAAAQEHDLILLNAGSSAGAEDFSARIVEQLGELLVHGVAVRPGHPVILGMLQIEERQVPIIGVPGYPVSAALTGEIFVEPLLARWLGRQPREKVTVEAQLTRKLNSPGGDDDYVRVAVGYVGERLLAAPLSRGAGVISSLVRADGLALMPRGSQGASAGEKVNVQLYREPQELERTIFAIGSHDIVLDLLAQFLAPQARRLVSANVGSIGGLVALRRGVAHLAGSHLLDPESGEYNLKYIQEYLPEEAINVLGLVNRQQGLLLRSGNPKNIMGLEDLKRPDVRYINRQRGAGTRMLLDHHLNLMGIAPDELHGYNREEYTHLSVAAAIASGRADCGLGIAAAAQALQLDFIPLFEERYDLILPRQFHDDPLLAPLLDCLHSARLRKAIEDMPGYNTAPLGELIAEVN